MEEHDSSSHCRRPSADILSQYLQQVTEAEHCRDEVIRVNALESKLVLVEIKKHPVCYPFIFQFQLT